MEKRNDLAFLPQVWDLERIDRDRRAASQSLKVIKFPEEKMIDTFEFKVYNSVNRPEVLELAGCLL